jgi:Domain of unknown function (DUF222)
MFERLVRIRGQLGELVTAVDPDAVSGRMARELWAEFDRIERLGAAGKTLLARRVAATHRAGSAGTKSAADDLARRGGTPTGAAREALETSSRLAELPGVEGALRRGELSAAQAALISAAAAASPAAEDRLLELATQISIKELRDECARVKATADPDPDATNRRIHDERRLRRWTDAEGAWNLFAHGTPQQGAAFNTVIDPIIEQIFAAARSDGRRESHGAYAFDALMAMADRAAGCCSAAGRASSDDAGVAAVDRDDDDAVDGADSPQTLNGVGQPGIFAVGRPESGPACAVRPGRWTNPRYLALLRVDVQALRRGRVAGDELCEIGGVGPVPVSVARGLLGEAIVKLVITRGVDVLNVTHLGRGPTAAQRAALLWLNPTCSAQGCHRARIEWDHRQPWASTGHTRLDELDPLCEFHHDLKTRLGHALVAGTGKRPLVPPDDPRHPGFRKARRDPGGRDTGKATTAVNRGEDHFDNSQQPVTPAVQASVRGTRRRFRSEQQAFPDVPAPPGSG